MAKEWSPFFGRALRYALAEVGRVGALDALTPALRTVVLVHSVQGIINNGGFQYFFESNFPKQPSYDRFVEAYRAIGAEEPASDLEQAVRLFPFSEPEKFKDRRNAFMDQFKDEEGDDLPDSPFAALSRKLCGNEQVWELLERYVTRHAASFPV